MPGKRITSQQVEIYMKSRKTGNTQIMAAAKAGISEKSGRSIEHGKHSTETQVRYWRTRPDPLAKVWENLLVPMLENTPGLMPITLLEFLQEQYSGQYPDNILRTLERRVKEWKAFHGEEKEVIFRQTHEPGRLGLSDFTNLKGINITIRGQLFSHILYHFRLIYSKWSYIKVILGGESYTALTEGLQDALWRLGGSPLEHRTDNLSAAFKNLSKNEQKDITDRYNEFCNHYNMKATRNNPGVSHENGGVESAHGHLKRRIKQALLLRGSNDFSSKEDYQEWLDKVVQSHNRRNAKQIDIERRALQPLPKHKTTDFTELVTRVTSSATINVKRGTYTVPSRLKGEILRVHVYHDRLVCYLGVKHVITLDRLSTVGKTKRVRLIDYRHVIDSLRRKPQAFRYSQIRDDLLPSDKYREIWKYIDKTIRGKGACKLIVDLLYLAAKSNCEEQIAEEVLALIAESKMICMRELERRYLPRKEQLPLVEVKQHNLAKYDFLIYRINVMEKCYA